MRGRAYIGTSGFYYAHWRGVFYPDDLPKSRYFSYYMDHFDTVELNSTFYHLPKAKTIEHWLSLAKEDFLFSLKAYRVITHYKKLKNCEKDIALFLHLIKPLKSHLGVILFQLPPSLHYDFSLLAQFLHILPSRYHYAVEFRHASWYRDDIYELLKRYNIAFCIHDFEKRPTPIVVSGKNSYIRFHGTNGRYAGSYPDDALQEWAQRIEGFLERGHNVFVYFNNDFEGAAIFDAKRLISFLHKEEKPHSPSFF